MHTAVFVMVVQNSRIAMIHPCSSPDIADAQVGNQLPLLRYHSRPSHASSSHALKCQQRGQVGWQGHQCSLARHV